MNEWAFVRLNEVAVESFYQDAPYHTWNGKRLLAVDGTRLMLPNHQSVIDEFGQSSYGPKSDSPRSVAIASMLYDVLNQITLDASIAPYKKKSGERALLVGHMDKLKPKDLLLLDRGYPSILLFYQLFSKGVDFCTRMKGSWWNVVRDFRKSNEKETIVSFSLPEKDKAKLENAPDWIDKEIKMQAVKNRIGFRGNRDFMYLIGRF